MNCTFRLGGAALKSPCQQTLSPAASPSRLVSREQHRGWCSLGFVRSIALTPHMCAALSSPPWITLLMRVVEGHAPFTAASLQRQVTCCPACPARRDFGVVGTAGRSSIKMPTLPVLEIRRLGSAMSVDKNSNRQKADF